MTYTERQAKAVRAAIVVAERLDMPPVDPVILKDLCRVHETLADYTGNLPSFTMAMDTCRTLLTDASALCALAPTDRAFLLAEYDRLRGQLASLPYVSAPLHGDPHLGNVLMTSRGPRWTDWEAACVGPREWDFSCLPETTLAVCRTIDHVMCNFFNR